MKLSIIVAMDDNYLIGKDNSLPWYLPADLAYFKKITIGKTILMGRKTYDSIGRSLPNRRNIIVSKNTKFKADNCEVVSSIDVALSLTNNDNELMIVGGSSFYDQTIDKVDRLYITEVKGTFDGDAYFPEFDRTKFIELSRESHKPDEKNFYTYNFIVLQRNTY